MARKHENDSRGAVRSDPGGTERRDVRREIAAALADPILKEAMSRALATMHRRREAAIPSQEWFEERRERARAVKDEALDRQSELLAEFVRKASAAGAVVEQAADAAAACAYICDLARRRGVELVVKSKSMTTEEIDLAHALERTGVSVIETDLGERIIQLAGERPSHLVAPAIHKNKEEIIRLCSEKMTPVCPPTDAEGLTRLVRAELRDSFLKAAMGITGANFAVAETGSIVIVENEGNASLATLLPPIHVAVVGREKLIPRLADLAVFMELLPRSAAGQKMTGYVSILTGVQAAPLLGRPGAEREFHLVILDNGRSAALDDPGLREMLRCIRCGACLNACAPYSLVGGHVFGGDPYPGGIGCAWTYVTKGHAQARDFNGLCSTCSRCTEVCPVKIDIPWVNTLIHQRNNREFGTGMRERAFARTDLMGKSLSALAPLSTPRCGARLDDWGWPASASTGRVHCRDTSASRFATGGAIGSRSPGSADPRRQRRCGGWRSLSIASPTTICPRWAAPRWRCLRRRMWKSLCSTTRAAAVAPSAKGCWTNRGNGRPRTSPSLRKPYPKAATCCSLNHRAYRLCATTTLACLRGLRWLVRVSKGCRRTVTTSPSIWCCATEPGCSIWTWRRLRGSSSFMVTAIRRAWVSGRFPETWYASSPGSRSTRWRRSAAAW
jgi:iron-sulfur cluster protein